MKTFFKSAITAVILLFPCVAAGQNFTGKTLSKSAVSAGSITPASILSPEATPCYALDQISEGDLNSLINLGLFFGAGAGDSNPILNVQALGSTNIAITLRSSGFDDATIFAFLDAQLRFIYDC